MTRPPDPDTPLDADRYPTSGEVAVNAILDGEATAEQRRRVARDPQLVALLAEMQTVTDAVAAVPSSPPASTFDRVRATALDAPALTGHKHDLADEDAHADPGFPSIGDDPTSRDDDGRDEVVALERRRAPRSRSLPPLPAVAAVVVLLLALGVGLIVNGQGERDEETTAASAQDSPDEATRGDVDSADGGAEAEADDAPVPGGSSAASEVSATFPDDAALRMALEQTDPATLDLAPPDVSGEEAEPEATEPDDRGASEDSARPTDEGRALAASPEAARCSAALEASEPTIAPAVAAALVTVDGQERLVLTNPVAAREGTPAAIQITVFEAGSCVPLFAVQRDP